MPATARSGRSALATAVASCMSPSNSSSRIRRWLVSGSQTQPSMTVSVTMSMLPCRRLRLLRDSSTPPETSGFGCKDVAAAAAVAISDECTITGACAEKSPASVASLSCAAWVNMFIEWGAKESSASCKIVRTPLRAFGSGSSGAVCGKGFSPSPAIGSATATPAAAAPFRLVRFEALIGNPSRHPVIVELVSYAS